MALWCRTCVYIFYTSHISNQLCFRRRRDSTSPHCQRALYSLREPSGFRVHPYSIMTAATNTLYLRHHVRRHDRRDAGSIYFKCSERRSVYSGRVSRFTFTTHCTHLEDKYTAKCFSAASQLLMATLLILPRRQKRTRFAKEVGPGKRPQALVCCHCPQL